VGVKAVLLSERGRGGRCFQVDEKKQSIKNVGKVLQSTIRMTTFTKLYGKLLNYLGQIEVLREKLRAKVLVSLDK
jgi:hypothetical protein